MVSSLMKYFSTAVCGPRQELEGKMNPIGGRAQTTTTAKVYQRQRLLMLQHAVDVVDDLPGVVVGDLAGPAGPDALGAVDQHHRDDGNIPFWLHLLVVVKQELEQVGVDSREQGLGQRAEWAERQRVRRQLIGDDREAGRFLTLAW